MLGTPVLRTNLDGLLNDFNTFGFLIESLCTRDIRIYSQAIDGDVFHYRDKVKSPIRKSATGDTITSYFTLS